MHSCEYKTMYNFSGVSRDQSGGVLVYAFNPFFFLSYNSVSSFQGFKFQPGFLDLSCSDYVKIVLFDSLSNLVN